VSTKRRVAPNAPAEGPGQFGRLARADCASTTYVRGRARAEWLGDNSRCSSAPASGSMAARRHSSQAGHKKEQEDFCRVTTRPPPAVRPETIPRHEAVRRDDHRWHAAGRAVLSRRPHALLELPAADAVVAAAWRPANAAPVSGTLGLGSNVDSAAGPDRCCHTPGAGTSASQAAGCWSNGADSKYAADVPREGLLPTGPPERSAKSLGHLFFLIAAPSPTRWRLIGVYTKRASQRCVFRVSELSGVTAAVTDSPFKSARKTDKHRQQRGARGRGRRQGRRRSRFKSRSKETRELYNELSYPALLMNALKALAINAPFPACRSTATARSRPACGDARRTSFAHGTNS
jgi:hypothetical protein